MLRQGRIAPGASAGRIGLWLPVLLYCAGIFYLSSLSRLPAPVIAIPDKLGHAALYGGLGFLVARYAMQARLFVPVPTWAVAAIFCLVYGVSDEVHQLFIEGRTAELGDVLADLVGGSVGGYSYTILMRFRGEPADR